MVKNSDSQPTLDSAVNAARPGPARKDRQKDRLAAALKANIGRRKQAAGPTAPADADQQAHPAKTDGG